MIIHILARIDTKLLSTHTQIHTHNTKKHTCKQTHSHTYKHKQTHTPSICCYAKRHVQLILVYAATQKDEHKNNFANY